MPVVTVMAESSEGALRDFTLTGTVTARRQARLSSRATGLVKEVKVDAGSRVAPGDVLLTLDTRLAEISLDLIRAEILRTEVDLADARRREKEARGLAELGGFAKSQAETLQSTVRGHEATLGLLEVRVREQSEMIARHRLVAPFGGVISQKMTEEGEWVPTGTPVMELVETDHPRFELQIPQEYFARVSRVEEIVVNLDARPGGNLEAHVSAVVPVKDEVSRTFLTRLELNDPGKLAAPGMSGAATLSFPSAHADAVRVPRDAVVRFPDGAVKVWVVSRSEGKAIVNSRSIRTGGAFGEFAEIIEGLEGGEEVVLKGNEGLREDQAVRLLNPGVGAVSGTP